MRVQVLAAFLILTWASTGIARATAPHPERFCDTYLQAAPDFTHATEEFEAGFLRAIPAERLTEVFRDIFAEAGACGHWTFDELPEGHSRLRLTTARQLAVHINVHFDATSGLCDGLVITRIEDPRLVIQSWADVEQALDSFLGTTSASSGAYLGTSDGMMELGVRPDQSFAIGSTFKLYVLGALQSSIASQAHAWGENLAIQDALKSLPSGSMQDFDNGELHPLQEYAFRMIGGSDNTATDHLMHLLGRESIEAMLPVMGVVDSSRSIPFLSTREMFQLKWGVNAIETQTYLDSDLMRRREILSGFASRPLSQIGQNGASMDAPTRIRELEWFASPRENCKAMIWLAKVGSSEVREMLEYRVPFVDRGRPQSHWTYAGYKGGSEPGVLNATYLLGTASGKRACFAMSWNDAEHTLGSYRFFDLVEKTIRFAETVVP